MSQKQPSYEPETVISIADFFSLLYRKRRTILISILCFGLAASLFPLTRPLRYTSQGLFKESQNNQARMGKSLFDFISSGGGGQDNEAVTLIKSRRIMQGVVKDLGLQVDVTDKTTQTGFLKRMWDNILLQYAHFKRRESPSFPDQIPLVVASEIRYEEDYPLILEANFSSSKDYMLFDSNKMLIGRGSLEFPFEHPLFSFVLNENGIPLKGKTLSIKLIPLNSITKLLSNAINVESDKKTKHVLEISYTHPSRKQSIAITNSVMNTYRRYLIEQNQDIANQQIAYLDKRKQDSFKEQHRVMKDYAAELSKDVASCSIAGTDVEMKFLLEMQLNAIKTLNTIDIESKRLSALQESPHLPLDQINVSQSQGALQAVETIRECKQQRDALYLALQQKKKEKTPHVHQTFQSLTADLDKTNEEKQEIDAMISDLSTGRHIDQTLAIYNNSHHLIKPWNEKLLVMSEQGSGNLRENYKNEINDFIRYLRNLSRFYEVLIETLKERLSHHYEGNQEFQGTDLQSINTLYLAYSKDCHQIEAEIQQNTFLMNQLQDPEFQVAALSATVQDPVCREIIQKSTQLSLMLHDQTNHSPREHERIRTELTMHRNFLINHLDHSSKLLELRYNLLQEKIYALQEIMLELLNEKISVLERNLRENIVSQQLQLAKEKEIIDRHLSSISSKMSHVPKKWVQEQIVKQNVELTRATVEELSRLVEGKNISYNLEVVQSKAIDEAFASLLPDNPKIPLFFILGSLIGAFFSIGFLTIQSIWNGVSPSTYNLSLSGYQAAGFVRKYYQENELIIDRDLATLRHCLSLLPLSSPWGTHIVSLYRYSQDLSPYLAALLTKQGKQPIIVSLDFQSPQSEKESGLLDFLEGRAEAPHIYVKKDYDFIASGGFSRYGIDLIASEEFQDYYRQLSKRYDIVIFSAPYGVLSAEAAYLMQRFDQFIISLEEEKLHELNILRRYSEKKFVLILRD
ncbi:MAG: hypothetical protein Tsb0021_08400 [Chlamydiales bacterium]